MRVEDLALEDFRNYRRERVSFAQGLNLVIGRNAQGKTNLLEAVYCLSGFGSPRGPDATVVAQGAEAARLHAVVARAERRTRVDLEMRPGRGTRALVNGTPVPGARSLGGVVTTVFFGPDELSLVKGSPDGRRRFLDELTVKLRPARDALRREWERVLKQRNALLKSAPRGGSAEVARTLDVWDESLCRAGGALAAARLEALGRLLPHAVERYAALAGAGALELEYASAWIDDDTSRAAVDRPGSVDAETLRDALARRVEDVRDREIERGASLVGPQRDDVVVRLTSERDSPALDARAFASQGEQRTAALALKLGEHDLLTDALGDRPVLLLDDVFSELDPRRREWLADAVRAMGQTLLSSADPAAVEEAGPERVVTVAGGRTEVGAP